MYRRALRDRKAPRADVTWDQQEPFVGRLSEDGDAILEGRLFMESAGMKGRQRRAKVALGIHFPQPLVKLPAIVTKQINHT